MLRTRWTPAPSTVGCGRTIRETGRIVMAFGWRLPRSRFARPCRKDCSAQLARDARRLFDGPREDRADLALLEHAEPGDGAAAGSGHLVLEHGRVGAGFDHH